jgi:hypothetical protein
MGENTSTGNTPGMYTRYPASSVALYNVATIAHYLAGGAGIIWSYGSWPGLVAGLVYLIFALVQMYILMPVKVCPNCVYYRLQDSLCISGMNLFSRKLAPPGDIKSFSVRAKGALCPNNLYIAALVIPIVAMIPALIINFSVVVLILLLIVIGLLIFRIYFIFPKVACVHCRAKNICPNARSMKLNDN